MIPRSAITEWRNTAPWQEDYQVEQDLIICRALTEIYSDSYLHDRLAFRGGTALYKIYSDKAVRYSEDISLITEHEKSIQPLQINIEKLKSFDTAVILSAGHNDPPYIQDYSVHINQEKQILSFKTPFGKEKDGVKGDIGILIVVEMLLTGFDAPVEQVMYLDRMIVAHNLLQAIERVNRTGGDNKNHGFLVDYVGVGTHLREALNKYFKEEEANESFSLVDETAIFKELEVAHKALWEVLKNSGINDLNDLDALYDIFYDEELRFKFIEAYRKFMKAMNDVNCLIFKY